MQTMMLMHAQLEAIKSDSTPLQITIKLFKWAGSIMIKTFTESPHTKKLKPCQCSEDSESRAGGPGPGGELNRATVEL